MVCIARHWRQPCNAFWSFLLPAKLTFLNPQRSCACIPDISTRVASRIWCTPPCYPLSPHKFAAVECRVECRELAQKVQGRALERLHDGRAAVALRHHDVGKAVAVTVG